MICVTLHYLNGYEIILFLILFIFEKSIYIYIYTQQNMIYTSHFIHSYALLTSCFFL